MPVPVSITDLSTTASSNFPAGTDTPASLDDTQRAHASFIAQLRDRVGATGNGISTPWAEVGPIGTSNTPFLDFHSSAASTDYDSRLLASGGSAVAGAGALQYIANGGHTFTGPVSIAGVDMNTQKTLANKGYQFFPGGLVIQWGSTVVTTDVSGNAPIAFQISFPTAVLTVMVANGDQGAGPYTVGSYTTGWPTVSGHAITVKNSITGAPIPGANARINWMALGY